MKLIFIIFFLIFSNFVFANEVKNGQVEVINLYESKSLDQMVLDNLNEEKEIEDISDDSNDTDEKVNNEIDVSRLKS